MASKRNHSVFECQENSGDENVTVLPLIRPGIGEWERMVFESVFSRLTAELVKNPRLRCVVVSPTCDLYFTMSYLASSLAKASPDDQVIFRADWTCRSTVSLLPSKQQCIVIKQVDQCWHRDDTSFSDGYHWIDDAEKRVIIQWATMRDPDELQSFLERIGSEYMVLQVY